MPGDVLKCLTELGINVERVTAGIKGDEAHALCPNPQHDDRHPSWSVNTYSGLHGCWSCGWKGDFSILVEAVLKCDRSESANWIRKRGAIDAVRRYLDPIAERERPQFNDAALALFTDPPLSACSSRLIDIDACKELGVLWNPEHEMWITPIRAPGDGRLLGWQEKNARHFRNKPYGVQKHTTLFGLHAFTGTRAILVESPLDAVRLRSVGLTGGLSSFGAKVSSEQMDLILEVADELIIALDNDAAGHEQTAKILEFYQGRIKLRVLDYTGTDAKDVGEMTADEIGRAISQAQTPLQLRWRGRSC